MELNGVKNPEQGLHEEYRVAGYEALFVVSRDIMQRLEHDTTQADKLLLHDLGCRVNEALRTTEWGYTPLVTLSTAEFLFLQAVAEGPSDATVIDESVEEHRAAIRAYMLAQLHSGDMPIVAPTTPEWRVVSAYQEPRTPTEHIMAARRALANHADEVARVLIEEDDTPIDSFDAARTEVSHAVNELRRLQMEAQRIQGGEEPWDESDTLLPPIVRTIGLRALRFEYAAVTTRSGSEGEERYWAHVIRMIEDMASEATA